jgi:hypothetical protein
MLASGEEKGRRLTFAFPMRRTDNVEFQLPNEVAAEGAGARGYLAVDFPPEEVASRL